MTFFDGHCDKVPSDANCFDPQYFCPYDYY